MGEHYSRALTPTHYTSGHPQDSRASSAGCPVTPASKEESRGWEGARPWLTIDGGKDDTGVVVGNDICVAVLGLVYLQV